MTVRKRLRAGFTLVELMIVVAIIGILAVLAIYGVRKYIANAKTGEARNNLGKMQRDALAAFEREKLATSGVMGTSSTTNVIRVMCKGAGAPVPASPPQAQKYQSKKDDWDVGDETSSWRCLRFEMTSPQYYSYNYISNGGNAEGNDYTAQARGDLNGDGTDFSTFSAYGKIQEGRLTASPQIEEINPEE